MQSVFVIITNLIASKNYHCEEFFCNDFGRDGMHKTVIFVKLLSKQQPEGPLTEDPSTQASHHDHGRVFRCKEAAMKIKHFRKGAHANGGDTVFATIADGMGRRKENRKTHPESAIGCLLVGWVLGRSLIISIAAEGHHPRATTLCEPLRGNLPLRGPRGLGRGLFKLSVWLREGARDFLSVVTYAGDFAKLVELFSPFLSM